MLDPHGMDPQTVLRFVKYVGGWPGRVFVVACEPEVVEDVGFGLSRRGQRRARAAPPTSCSRRSPSCSPTATPMHELSVATAVLNTALKHADGRRVTLVSVRVGRAAPGRARVAAASTGRSSPATRRARARTLELIEIEARLRCRDCEREWSPEIPAFRCPDCGSARRRGGGRRGARGRLHRGRGTGGRMHRTKVRVVEDALDANNTIAARQPRRLRPPRRDRR